MVFGNLTEAENETLLQFMKAKRKNNGEDLVKAWTQVIRGRCQSQGLPPFGALGASPQPATRTVIILQREVGHLRSYAKEGVPSTATIKHIASLDATSCLIVGLRSNLVTTVAHFDGGGDVMTIGIESMVKWIMEVHRLDGSLPKKVPEGSEEAQQNLDLELYVVGGAIEYKHSLPSLVSLLFIMVQLQKRPGVRVHLNCAGSCFWDLNTTDDRQLNYRGLSINVEDGAAYPIEVTGKARVQAYPQAYLRSLACFSDDRKDVLSWVTPKMSRNEKGELTGDLFPSYKGDHAQDVVIVIRPFGWTAFPTHLVRLPRAEFLKWSTTPTMEADDFPEVMRASIVFANTTNPSTLFGADRRALLLYRYNVDKDEWVPLEFVEASEEDVKETQASKLEAGKIEEIIE